METCTTCGVIITGYPAISRKDNSSPVCSTCGAEEALDAWSFTEGAWDAAQKFMEENGKELGWDEV